MGEAVMIKPLHHILVKHFRFYYKWWCADAVSCFKRTAQSGQTSLVLYGTEQEKSVFIFSLLAPISAEIIKYMCWHM